MEDRRTALQTVQRKAFGGSYFDSFTHSAMFRKYGPYNFGIKSSQIFASELGSHRVNKKFTYYTVAQGNMYDLPAGHNDYEWYLMADADVDFEFTELLVAADSYPGKNGMEFKIALNRDWLHEPAIIKLEGSDLPLVRIIGHPTRRGANSFEYTCELQTGDPSSWIPVDYLMPGRTAIRASSGVSDELNTKYGPDQYGEMFKLQSWIGYFANKAEFTDKFIRLEMAAREKGGRMSSGMSYSVDGTPVKGGAVGVGYVYKQQFDLTNSNKAKKLEAGVFISQVEALVFDRSEMDREMNFEFGQVQKTRDRDTDRPIKFAPGWRQIVKDGHYKEHNGSLTLSEIFEYLYTLFFSRRRFSDRYIIMATGEAGLIVLNRLISEEAANLVTVDSHFIESTSSPHHQRALAYGAQFTKVYLNNGVTVELVHDPIKDDEKIFGKEKAPGTNFNLESYAHDIFDFGSTNQKAFDAQRSENITAVTESAADEYYTVCNVYDFMTGAKKDGSNAYSNGKECGVYRAISGGLCVWDVSRVGRIAFNPYIYA